MISAKELSDISFERLKNALAYVKKNLIDSIMYLTVDSLIYINNIITGSNNITLRKVNVKPCLYDKINIDKDLIKDILYQLADQFSERKINHRDFYCTLLNNMHPFYDGNRKDM